jgi:high-affinity Fe2+/Pb2+ permease
MQQISIPDELKLLIASAIGFIVTEGLKSLSNLLKFDISGYGAVITAALVTALIVFFEAILGAVPADYQASVTAALGLLVAILGAFGIHRQFKR